MDQVSSKPVNAVHDSGMAVLLMMAQFHGIAADEAKLRHEFGYALFDTQTILRGAKLLGMSARAIRQPHDRLDKAPLPAVGCCAGDKRYFIAGRYIPGTEGKPSTVLIQFPAEPPQMLSVEDFLSIWSGELIFFTSKASFVGALAKFDFTWFIPAIVKYRRLLGEVFLISLLLQIIALVTPLFFQVIMDKVLVNHAMKTLEIIAIGLVFATLFEEILSGIRTYVFAHTSSKIDVELGARLFRHLLALPLPYFQARRVGDSVARIRELENIRSFLTGNAITLVLDVAFSFVFLAVMLSYSVRLTLIVLASIPLYVLVSLVLTPVIRRRLDDKFNKSAENQSFQVESISGVDTIKAMAVEPRWIDRWDKQLAAYVTSGLSVSNAVTLASGSISLISKLVTVGIIWMGATLVIDNKLTVGELIAFNMLASHVSGPILRLAQLWNDFQQVGISVHRLGDILNTSPEAAGQKTRVPRLEGAIEFYDVSFRYRPDAGEAIRQVSFKVAPGEVIGIVGRSGSGKSTLSKLVQRLYIPERGRVLIDGHDIAVIDTASLRQQIGVVLQESTLFNRSIRDNIALVNPTLPIEEIIHAAQLVGAHEFICELPEGYDTLIGENGTGLSGGQRQRIAVARALINNPRILIFDEATSALDYESEAILQANMRRICEGRTVIIIAHRLSAVREAHRIMVMDRGRIVESGSHDTLVVIEDGIYANLYRLQQGQV